MSELGSLQLPNTLEYMLSCQGLRRFFVLTRCVDRNWLPAATFAEAIVWSGHVNDAFTTDAGSLMLQRQSWFLF
jgi:hypothetical protein